MNFKYLLLGLMLLFLSGCSPSLMGKVENDIYTSANGMFSLTVPVDLSSGGNGGVIDGDDNVVFTYMTDGEFSVNSFPHSKKITEENKLSTTKNALKTITGQNRPYVYEEYFPSIKEGTTFIVIELPTENEHSPNILGIGAFWTKTRFIVVAARQSTSAFFLADDKSINNQINMLKDLLLPVLKTVEVDNR